MQFLLIGVNMTGYELRIWRKGMEWTQERAAEELGVSLRTYANWERSGGITRVAALATKGLSVERMWPEVARLMKQLSVVARHG